MSKENLSLDFTLLFEDYSYERFFFFIGKNVVQPMPVQLIKHHNLCYKYCFKSFRETQELLAMPTV